jgi:arginase family enzyme
MLHGNKTVTSQLFETTLVLDFDGSVSLPKEIPRLDLRDYEEMVRYYLSFGDMTSLGGSIKEAVERHRVFFLGNGDFHHVSYLLIEHMPYEGLHVVVFDNHPDNMFFPAGIHCGSWVYHASKLPNVSNISVFGIASKDIRGFNMLQNSFSVIRSGKVKYYCLAPVSKLMRLLSGNAIDDIRASQKSVAEILKEEVQKKRALVYLSIDKDVLSGETLRTGWDQGQMQENELLGCIEEIAHSVIAADIVGDLSSYNYKSRLKKIMRMIDGYEQMPINIEKEQLKHRELNMKILSLLKGISA